LSAIGKVQIAEVIKSSFDDFQVKVVALEAERTFWEKATILHAQYHRPADQPIRERFARHYADVASLWENPARAAALARLDLLERVVKHKSRFFASSWANYETAKPGGLKLLPPSHREADLEQDYDGMQTMFWPTRQASAKCCACWVKPNAKLTTSDRNFWKKSASKHRLARVKNE
jgi:hypothetical protein